MTEYVTVLVKDDGSIVFDFNGFQGRACYAEAEKLMAGLKDKGVDVTERQLVDKEGEDEHERETVKC